ncbi:MAG: UDP-N-acetylglucosamine 1-carboxyvinyltransferase [Oscillospiraceae bacterium]|nr:UDP-N-acetylglucosamine 1-carboxyvinyltransferase [Oscillospiraceae bacterium]MCI8714735.1 UDP-N-acetylglucosamine 1-carboxyvinyltransferase [Oscillospiraceae bacterium]MCI9316771.1 UDP-N-acetylglucosamine 1-carboxyvinyltransferase [Oscillospiraceae bacterium]
MSHITIQGGRRLEGALTVQGAKNSVLPILAATILHPGRTVLRGCPRLSDVEASIRILRHLGCLAGWEGEELVVDTGPMSRGDIPDHLMREMRSSVIFLGAILARLGWAEMSYPGGCELGPRPIDLHLAALRQLGAELKEEGGRLLCGARRMTGREIALSLPSVGATENAILAACGAEGETILFNAAREPEIADLQDFLCAMGCKVRGAGSSTVCVMGRQSTHDAVHTVMPDRIAAATYLSAVAAAGGQVELLGVDYRHLSTVTAALHAAGCQITGGEGRISLRSDGALRSAGTVRTAPYPGFPTDAQAVVMAALLRSQGATVFVENIFENRYRHVDELRRMGADISVADRVAVVTGVPRLFGADVRATDLRGGAALLVAGLAARGTTRIGDIYHIQRGYADPVGDLRALGAEISLEED